MSYQYHSIVRYFLVKQSFRLFQVAGKIDMDSAEVKDYLMNSLCRICGEKSSKLIPIFEIKLLPFKICKCLPIKVTAADDLPVNICEVCMFKIEESYLLYQTCYFADQRLKKLWKSFGKQFQSSKEFMNDTSETRDHLITIPNYEKEYIEAKKSFVINNEHTANKKVPVGVIFVNETVTLHQNFGSDDYQCKTGDVLVPSEIIHEKSLNFNCPNVMPSSKDEAPEFITQNILNKNEDNFQDKSSHTYEAIPKGYENRPDDVQQENVAIIKELGNEKLIESEVYQCRHCSYQLYNLSSLNEHELTHSPEKQYLCDTCGKSFKHANNLKSHVKVHSPYRKKYICKICNKSFFTNFFLQEHMNTHTGETPYKCQVCGKEFREKVHLRQHKWTHSSVKFLCPVCGNHFNRKGNMTEHIKKYHSSIEDKKQKPKKTSNAKLTCAVCSKTFSSQILLKKHQKHHLNKALYFCSLCGKEFRHSGSLTYHRRTAHTGEKPFQCSYCEERFSLRSVQRIHERKRHTFENPYKCPFCTKTFYNSSSLKNHSYVHMKEKMFECDTCGKRFSRNSNLYVHKKIHSDDRKYTCEQCGKSYIQKHDMIKHKKVHDPKSKPFFCKYCGNSFSHKKDFAKHAICHFDYIRKSNCDVGSAEKLLEIVEGDLQKNSKTLFDAERLILESSYELVEEKLGKTDFSP